MTKNFDQIDAQLTALIRETAAFEANFVYVLGTHEQKWLFRDILKRFLILELEGGSYVSRETQNFFERHKAMGGGLELSRLRLDMHKIRQYKKTVAEAKEVKLDKEAKAATTALNKAEQALKAAQEAYEAAEQRAKVADSAMATLERAQQGLELAASHEWSKSTLDSLPASKA